MATAQPLLINGIAFASAETIAASMRAYQSGTEALTVADQIRSLEPFIEIPRLTVGTFGDWCKALQRAIKLTKSAAGRISLL